MRKRLYIPRILFIFLFFLSLPSCNVKPAQQNHYQVCTDEMWEEKAFCTLEECQEEKIWISPNDSTLIFPKFGIENRDLFVQNRDRLKGYFLNPKLVNLIGEVLTICHEIQTQTDKKLNLRFNSLVRSVAYNRRIGGAANSEHLEPVGHAVDIRFSDGKANRYFIQYFYKSVFKKDSTFQRLFEKGCRSFGFYSWGIHFGVRKRKRGSRTFNDEVYAIWDKR
ncbi:MAG: D-Ala-D-Ala carboxypeptidase family metallohydrolase [Bacteroidetes bacterium]|nr:D-Ala-D-Ala carboxypeptidase family metallohydrolase [Bacteroidota bacterium]MDF1863629.1 D-Ala-D-Ala carboxypeptidase family metallohydrolase [Saprospiraceae bacterium]